MRSLRHIAFASFLALQACVTSQDVLMRSSSHLPLPLGTIHVPPQDSGLLLQGSIAVSGQSSKDVPATMTLQNGLLHGNNGNSSQVLGPSYVSAPTMQVAAEGSIFMGNHLRLGLGLEGTTEHIANWIEVGIRGGSDVGVEGFWAVGSAPVHSTAHWQIKTFTPRYSSFSGNLTGNDTTVSEKTIDTSASQGFYRVGLHVARRQGGPWAEVQLISIDLLPVSPSADDQWGSNMTLLGLGWSEPTPLGTATAYARGLVSKGNVHPIFGLQWTGELKLGK